MHAHRGAAEADGFGAGHAPTHTIHASHTFAHSHMNSRSHIHICNTQACLHLRAHTPRNPSPTHATIDSRPHVTSRMYSFLRALTLLFLLFSRRHCHRLCRCSLCCSWAAAPGPLLMVHCCCCCYWSTDIGLLLLLLLSTALGSTVAALLCGSTTAELWSTPLRSAALLLCCFCCSGRRHSAKARVDKRG